jgi:hypothetical protein
MTVLCPDPYTASMGCSGSTLIANRLSVPARNQSIFVEPNLTRGVSPLLAIQREQVGLAPALRRRERRFQCRPVQPRV